MQEISSRRHGGILEISDGLIAGVQEIAQRCSDYAGAVLGKLPGWMNKSKLLTHADALAGRHEVAIMYFGRTSEYLRMKSERMKIPDGRYTLGQLLCSLYKRGDRWADELDDSHLTCTVNGREAMLFDTIESGAEICISSKKANSNSGE